MAKEIKFERKSVWNFSFDAYKPKYELTLKNVDGTDDWKISGTVNDVPEEESDRFLVDIIVRNSMEKQNIKFGCIKGVLAVLSTLVVIGTLISVGIPKKSKEENSDETTSIIMTEEDDLTTYYMVDYETDVFSYLDSFTDYNYYDILDVAYLRGVSSLHDDDVTVCRKKITELNKVISNILSGKDVDLDEFLKQIDEVKNFSLIAQKDVENCMKLSSEENNYNILDRNSYIINGVENEINYLIEDVNEIKTMRNDFDETSFSKLGDRNIYNYCDSGKVCFATEKEAREYYDSVVSEYCSHLTYGEYDAKYLSTFDASIIKYDSTMDPNEFKELLENGEVTYTIMQDNNIDEEVIDNKSIKNLGR